MKLSRWIELFDEGRFDSADIDRVIRAGWTDWNCPEKRIPGKTRKCAKVLSLMSGDLLGYEVELRNICEDGCTLDRITLTGDTVIEIDMPSSSCTVRSAGCEIRCHGARECATAAAMLCRNVRKNRISP